MSPSRAKPGANLVNIPGFQPPFRRDRLHGRGGPGVGVYVRNGLNAVSTDMFTDLECVKITLHLPGKEKVSVVAVYRPPNFDCSLFVSELDSILTTRNSDSYLTCVVGRPREKKPALKKALNLVESFKLSWWLYRG